MTSSLFPDRRWFYLAAPLPAIIVGALVMRSHGVDRAVWGQNLIVGMLLAALCAAFLIVRPRRPARLVWGVASALALVLVLGTSADPGLEGVYRWVHFGPVRVHAGALCLPFLILALGEALALPPKNLGGSLAPLFGIGMMGLLVWQPDAAQATAFAGALITLLCLCRLSPWKVWPAVFATAACAVWAWKRPDPLPSLPHVEGIVGLAAQSGALWRAAALVALVLLPWPFLLARRQDGSVSSKGLALGVYFSLTLIAPLFGAFPVPLLGYGLSPIVGYFTALSWLMTRGSHRVV